MRHQLNFYLNDNNITDDFIIQELKKETNISGLVKSLLWDYYKTMKPFARLRESETKEREELSNGII